MFLATCFKHCSRGLPTTCFPDIARSRMFIKNSLCLIVFHFREWRLFCEIFKSNISSFALWKTSSFFVYIYFICNILLQHHVLFMFQISWQDIHMYLYTCIHKLQFRPFRMLQSRRSLFISPVSPVRRKIPHLTTTNTYKFLQMLPTRGIMCYKDYIEAFKVIDFRWWWNCRECQNALH